MPILLVCMMPRSVEYFERHRETPVRRLPAALALPDPQYGYQNQIEQLNQAVKP